MFNLINVRSFQGISLNDLLDKSKFVKDQRETVLEAIRTIDPFFEPVYTPSVLDYECPLLEKLKLQDIDKIRAGLNTSPAEGVLDLEQLKLQVKKQFEIEITGMIEVQNIDTKSDPSDTVKLYVSTYVVKRSSPPRLSVRSVHDFLRNYWTDFSPFMLLDRLIHVEVFDV